jgi:transcriptional regulator with XRE-family HTH domain
VSDLSSIQKFVDESYRVSYLDSHVKGSIAYQIQALRERTGLNQTQFGELIGQPQSVVSRLEDTEYGGVNINTLLKIANRLGIGLQVRFCNFETILAADVSPSALKVENITETVSRFLAVASPAPPEIVSSVDAILIRQNLEGNHPWQMNPWPNQPPPQWFPGSGTPNFAKFTPMPV